MLAISLAPGVVRDYFRGVRWKVTEQVLCDKTFWDTHCIHTCLVTTDGESTTNPSKGATQVQFNEPVIIVLPIGMWVMGFLQEQK